MRQFYLQWENPQTLSADSAAGISPNIWSGINFAQMIVADCTGSNPNVMYEVGLAHAIGKATILISQSINDIPFDIRHLGVIEYEFTPRGMKTFEDELKEKFQRVRTT